MLKLVKIQFRSANFKRFNIFAILLNIIFIISATLKFSKFDGINSIYQLSTLFLILLFFNLENNTTNIILNSLPINKRDIVIKNYIYIIIVFILAELYMNISFYIINSINTVNIEYTVFSKLEVYISIFIIQVSIILPMLHLTSGISSYFIVYLGMNIGGAVIMSYKDSIENMMGSGNLYILPVIAFLIMALSIAVSIFFYTHREFEGVVE